ncbi:hypothetical protein Pan216_30590 [Planctomycetes bacterium Pan216]|uniref:Apea-like HEPN domain-containing protein n=1 Tax=Kolteria novifilia TaxID=2527975 RepID=A0A518B5G6_9BACT|nr:hypothetical protein Pan216_30590 [Planctomycetes bacterium Pan216]
MSLLEYIRAAARAECKAESEYFEAEFRLLCSGTLYPDGIDGDWTKSDGARLLLVDPFQLIIASQPLNSFPQEIALRFKWCLETTIAGSTCSDSLQTKDIAGDIAALMTLLCRRLVTVGSEVRRRYYGLEQENPLHDFPFPLVNAERPAQWTPRPIEIHTSQNGHWVSAHDSQPVGFSRHSIRSILRHLPELPSGKDVLRAAHRYSLAMELIEREPEIAYQLLVSAVETIAGSVLKDCSPSTEEQLKSKNNLLKAIEDTGVCEEDAQRIVLQDKSNSWSRWKFRKFLATFVAEDEIEANDDLFTAPLKYLPKKADFKGAINDIYSKRSGASHSGVPLPPSATIGICPAIPNEVIETVTRGEKVFPPIVWFERIVNTAIRNCLGRMIVPTNSSPSVE